jgi:hypothetical protein
MGRGEPHDISERLRQVGVRAARSGTPGSERLNVSRVSGCATEPRTRQPICLMERGHDLRALAIGEGRRAAGPTGVATSRLVAAIRQPFPYCSSSAIPGLRATGDVMPNMEGVTAWSLCGAQGRLVVIKSASFTGDCAARASRSVRLVTVSK